jgi:hypothetical protein
MSNFDLLPGPDFNIDVGGLERRIRQEAQANAIYANVVARAYEKLVEDWDPEDAMPKAIERAEEVVKVWREVVK